MQSGLVLVDFGLLVLALSVFVVGAAARLPACGITGVFILCN